MGKILKVTALQTLGKFRKKVGFFSLIQTKKGHLGVCFAAKSDLLGFGCELVWSVVCCFAHWVLNKASCGMIGS